MEFWFLHQPAAQPTIFLFMDQFCLNSKKLSISPISPFRPRRWKGKIVSDKSKIIIKNLNHKKRPISAVADNIEVRNAKNVIVKTNKKIKFNLLYDKSRSLQKKIKIEQLRREIN